MEIRTLRYFLAVAREENMTRAAEVLHVTQPTLSKALRALEDELGKKLEDPANASDMKLVNQYTETQEALNKEMETWEELSLQIEN